MSLVLSSVQNDQNRLARSCLEMNVSHLTVSHESLMRLKQFSFTCHKRHTLDVAKAIQSFILTNKQTIITYVYIAVTCDHGGNHKGRLRAQVRLKVRCTCLRALGRLVNAPALARSIPIRYD